MESWIWISSKFKFFFTKARCHHKNINTVTVMWYSSSQAVTCSSWRSCCHRQRRLWDYFEDIIVKIVTDPNSLWGRVPCRVRVCKGYRWKLVVNLESFIEVWSKSDQSPKKIWSNSNWSLIKVWSNEKGHNRSKDTLVEAWSKIKCYLVRLNWIVLPTLTL